MTQDKQETLSTRNTMEEQKEMGNNTKRLDDLANANQDETFLKVWLDTKEQMLRDGSFVKPNAILCDVISRNLATKGYQMSSNKVIDRMQDYRKKFETIIKYELDGKTNKVPNDDIIKKIFQIDDPESTVVKSTVKQPPIVINCFGAGKETIPAQTQISPAKLAIQSDPKIKKLAVEPTKSQPNNDSKKSNVAEPSSLTGPPIKIAKIDAIKKGQIMRPAPSHSQPLHSPAVVIVRTHKPENLVRHKIVADTIKYPNAIKASAGVTVIRPSVAPTNIIPASAVPPQQQLIYTLPVRQILPKPAPFITPSPQSTNTDQKQVLLSKILEFQTAITSLEKTRLELELQRYKSQLEYQKELIKIFKEIRDKT